MEGHIRKPSMTGAEAKACEAITGRTALARKGGARSIHAAGIKPGPLRHC